MARLSNIAISFDGQGRSQNINGHIQADWQDEFAVTGRLTSSWLDIDRLTGGSTARAPYRIFAVLAASMTKDRASAGSSQIDLSIAQAKLGGETVRDISATFYNAPDKVRVERLRASVTGRTQLWMDAQLPTQGSKPEWQGHVLTRGGNFKGFSSWLWPGGLQVDGTATGEFELSSRFTLAPAAVGFSNAHLNIAGHRSNGLFRYDWTKSKPKLTLDWFANTMDVSGFGENALSNRNLAYALGFDVEAEPDSQPSHLAKLFRSADMDLRLDVGRLGDGKRTLTGLNMTLLREAGKLRFGKSRLRVEPGLSLQFEGDLEKISSGQRNWMLKGLVTAKSDAAVDELSDFLQRVTDGFNLQQNFSAIAPLEVAFSSRSDATAGKRRNLLEADGTMRSHRLRLSASTEGELKLWPDNNLHLNIKLDGKAKKLANAAAPDASASDNGNADSETIAPERAKPLPATADLPFYLRFNLAGVPRRQLKASATLASQAWRLNMQADSNIEADGETYRWTGVGSIQAPDLKSFSEKLDPSWTRLFPTAVAAGGQFAFAVAQNVWTFEPADFQLAGSNISGKLKLVFADAATGRPSLTGTATINRFEGDRLVQALLLTKRSALPDRSSSSPSPAPASASQDQSQLVDANLDTQAIQPVKSFWSDQTFDFTPINWLDVDLTVFAERIGITRGLEVRTARLHVANTSDVLTLKVLDSALLSGKATGEARFATTPLGVKVVAAVAVENAKASSLISTPLTSQTDGRISVNLDMSGQARNPRELINFLKGKGAVKLHNVHVRAVEPARLTEIADSTILGESPPEEFANRLNEALTGKPLKLVNQSAGLTLVDGELRVSQIIHGTGKHGTSKPRLTNQTVIDVDNMSIDSRWRGDIVLQRALEPDVVTTPLPPLQIVYVGPLRQLGQIEPDINIDALQRELTAQRMEYDVRRLERLRREDEERARQEAERLRLLEQERLKALEDAQRNEIATPQQQQLDSGDAQPTPATATAGTPPASRKTESVVTKETLPPPVEGLSQPEVAGSLPATSNPPPAQPQGAQLPPVQPQGAQSPPAQPQPQSSWDPFTSDN